MKPRLTKRACKKDLRICWDKKLEKLKRSIRKDSVSRLHRTFQPLMSFVLFSVCDISVSFTLYFSFSFVPIFFYTITIIFCINARHEKETEIFFFNSHNSVSILSRIDGEICENEREGEREVFSPSFNSTRGRGVLTISPGHGRSMSATITLGGAKFALLPRLTLLARVLKVFAAREHHAGL